jgi:hypothetical protein
MSFHYAISNDVDAEVRPRHNGAHRSRLDQRLYGTIVMVNTRSEAVVLSTIWKLSSPLKPGAGR